MNALTLRRDPVRLAFSRGLRTDGDEPSVDVLPTLGAMPWPRAMGTAACEEVCRFLLASTACRTVVDPFCGMGTMLAVAGAYGLDAIGVERSPRHDQRIRDEECGSVGAARSA